MGALPRPPLANPVSIELTSSHPKIYEIKRYKTNKQNITNQFNKRKGTTIAKEYSQGENQHNMEGVDQRAGRSYKGEGNSMRMSDS